MTAFGRMGGLNSHDDDDLLSLKEKRENFFLPGKQGEPWVQGKQPACVDSAASWFHTCAS